MAFNIGDRVRLKNFDEIGKIEDIMYSTAQEQYIYRIHFDGQDECSNADFTEDEFELLADEAVDYRFDTDIADNVVIVIMYEVYEDGTEQEIVRGHGHIIHEGALGIAQATSYAMYRAYKRLEENNF